MKWPDVFMAALCLVALVAVAMTVPIVPACNLSHDLPAKKEDRL